MNSESRVTVRWAVLVAAALALLAAGGGAAYVGLRSGLLSPVPSNAHAGTPSSSPATTPAMEVPSPAVVSGALPDVVVTLTKEGIDRAGIETAVVGGGTTSGGLRAPGVVAPNIYKQVVVTPIISGRITRVSAELGQHVQRGETIAQIFSPELAEAQTRYVSARAMLEAHERELTRTEKLVEIGAASRQELERLHAEHTARANVGLNVDQTTKLFTVVDLSTVWVVAELYEKDFARVSVGSPATITTRAYPDLVLQGRVSYIDPQVSAETRTAKVRIEVRNVRNELRFGMYVDALLGSSTGAATPMIPRSAVQNVGDRTVVYLANPKEPGTFVEREVRLGKAAGDQVPVLMGVQPGDVVVAEGSFFVRAERERLGLRIAPARPAARPIAPVPPPEARNETKVQEARVTV